jgi:TRAP-type C4-dicarboxylate transport system permease small subunit
MPMQALFFAIYLAIAVTFLLYVLRFLQLGIRYFERELSRDEPTKKHKSTV